MSDSSLSSITVLAGEFQSWNDLQAYSDKQFLALQVLQKENQSLKEEVTHLKTLLTSTAPLLQPEVLRIEVTSEQAICEIQIEKLRDKAHQRDLTLEETKKLEILVKSLYLIKEKTGTAISADFEDLGNNTSLESLALIAATPDPASQS